jgi:tetraacyldisaccharide 4'-kinase
VLILDDAFQHHRLARDVDLLLVDGIAGFGNGQVLPRGPLREFASGLSRAHAIGVIDGPLREEDRARLDRHAPTARRFQLRRRVDTLRPLAGGEPSPVSCLVARDVGLVCGLASPEGFRATVEGLGARVVAERCFPDHHYYRPADLAGLAGEASLWLTTEKDAVKMPAAWAGDAQVLVVNLELDVEESDLFLDWLEERLRAKPRGRDAALPTRREAGIDRVQRLRGGAPVG